MNGNKALRAGRFAFPEAPPVPIPTIPAALPAIPEGARMQYLRVDIALSGFFPLDGTSASDIEEAVIESLNHDLTLLGLNVDDLGSVVVNPQDVQRTPRHCDFCGRLVAVYTRCDCCGSTYCRGCAQEPETGLDCPERGCNLNPRG